MREKEERIRKSGKGRISRGRRRRRRRRKRSKNPKSFYSLQDKGASIQKVISARRLLLFVGNAQNSNAVSLLLFFVVVIRLNPCVGK
jgi:hypothetical protein